MIDIVIGDALQVLRSLPKNSVQAVITSPPYYRQRDYRIDGQHGLEKTPEEFLRKMVRVFREVRRVLKGDGTLWVNIGDTYAGDGAGYQGKNGTRAGRRSPFAIARDPGKRELPRPRRSGVRNKEMLMIPARLALALQADGWRLRQDIIWHKPNPMPESVRDRFTKAHEHLYLFSKQEMYRWDREAAKEPASSKTHARIAIGKLVPAGWDRGGGNHKSLDGNYAKKAARTNGATPKAALEEPGSRQNPSFAKATSLAVLEKRNRRSVWTIPVAPFKGAHFATFPSALIRTPILVSTRPGDTILDPFAGACTTGLVCDELGRNAILIELKPEYAEIGYHRCVDAGEPMFKPISLRTL